MGLTNLYLANTTRSLSVSGILFCEYKYMANSAIYLMAQFDYCHFIYYVLYSPIPYLSRSDLTELKEFRL